MTAAIGGNEEPVNELVGCEYVEQSYTACNQLKNRGLMSKKSREDQKHYDALVSNSTKFIRLLFVDLAGIRRCR